VEALKAIVAMPEPKRLQAQVKIAKALGDDQRKTRLLIRIKEVFFEQSGGTFKFDTYDSL